MLETVVQAVVPPQPGRPTAPRVGPRSYAGDVSTPPPRHGRPHGRPHGRTRPWAVRLLLLGALAGLFAMHGLGGHGTAMSEDAMAAMSATAHASGAGHDVSPPSAPVVTSPPTAVLTSSDPLGSAADHATMAMCLAVLLLAAALALARSAPVAALAPAPRPDARVLPQHPRTPDPPDLSRLCVLRC